LVRETVPPFSPDSAVTEHAAVVKAYGLSEITGDAYSGQFARELFQKQGVTYYVAEQNRSALYLECLPAIMSGRARFLDNKKLIAQFLGLERRTARAGKDSIDHGPGGHDDIANAVAGAVVLAMRSSGGVLGVFEYEKLEATDQLGTLQTQGSNREVLFRFEAKIRGLQPPAPMPTWKQEPLPPCPNCKSTCTAKLSQAEFRCAECATQWFKKGHAPKPWCGQRGEWLAGRLNAKIFNLRR
jgi:hypothetical protein